MSMYNPPHPGVIIREFCVEALNISVTEAAKALGVTRKTFSFLLNGRSGISPEMALRLSKVIIQTPPLHSMFDVRDTGYWMLDARCWILDTG